MPISIMLFQYLIIFIAFIATGFYIGFLISVKYKKYTAESVCKSIASNLSLVISISIVVYIIATWLPEIIRL